MSAWGSRIDLHPGPGFAALSRGDLQLLLNTPTGGGGASQPMPDGRRPEPGGWNRLQLRVDDLAHEVEVLKRAGSRFRNELVTGNGGKQIPIEAPSGNPIELFEAAAAVSTCPHPGLHVRVTNGCARAPASWFVRQESQA